MSEWAQPKRPSPDPDLKRGHWYLVEERTDNGGVTVIGPSGVRLPLNQSSFRIIDHEPQAITRVPTGTAFQTDPSDSRADLGYYGICPKGHNVGKIRSDDSHAQCSECNCTYAVEDEELWVGEGPTV